MLTKMEMSSFVSCWSYVPGMPLGNSPLQRSPSESSVYRSPEPRSESSATSNKCELWPKHTLSFCAGTPLSCLQVSGLRPQPSLDRPLFRFRQIQPGNHVSEVFVVHPFSVVVTAVVETVRARRAAFLAVPMALPPREAGLDDEMILECQRLATVVNRHHHFVQFLAGADSD